MNENGKYFPLFGTCLGFELLLYISNGNQEYRTTCSSQRQRNTLNFTKGKTKMFILNNLIVNEFFFIDSIDFRESRLFGDAPHAVLNMLQNEEVTSNFHSWCLTKQVKMNQVKTNISKRPILIAFHLWFIEFNSFWIG